MDFGIATKDYRTFVKGKAYECVERSHGDILVKSKEMNLGTSAYDHIFSFCINTPFIRLDLLKKEDLKQIDSLLLKISCGLGGKLEALSHFVEPLFLKLLAYQNPDIICSMAEELGKMLQDKQKEFLPAMIGHVKEGDMVKLKSAISPEKKKGTVCIVKEVHWFEEDTFGQGKNYIITEDGLMLYECEYELA